LRSAIGRHTNLNIAALSGTSEQKEIILEIDTSLSLYQHF
jgi:hypothetical protein